MVPVRRVRLQCTSTWRHTSDDRDAEIARLLSMGATRVDVGQHAEAAWDVFADPEGNEFGVLSSREKEAESNRADSG